MPIIVDSGASVNVIDRSMWEFLKKFKIKCESRLSDKKIYAYGNTQPLSVAGSFIARVSVGDKSVDAEFYVVRKRASVARENNCYIVRYIENWRSARKCLFSK